MSKTFKQPPTSHPLVREVVIKLRDFRPRFIASFHLTHFSTMPEAKGTDKALLVYQKVKP